MSWPPFLTPKSPSLEDFIPVVFKGMLSLAILIAAFRCAVGPGLHEVMHVLPWFTSG